jgi:hypothetical protein
MRDTETPRVFKPEGADWTTFGVCLLITGIVISAKHRPGDFAWWIDIPFLAAILGIGAYISFFSWKAWVFLYEDRLEFEFAFTKLVRERFGIALSKRRTVYFRTVRGLRKMHGFGAFNFLAIIWQTSTGEVREYGFPYRTLQDYPELEAELLRRIPANCELYSTGFTARRGPFK